MKFAFVIVTFLAATAANAQSVTSRVTGAVGGATSSVGVTAGNGSSSATGNATDLSALNSTPGGSYGAGGDWNGGATARIGGKDITIRGAVASEGGASAFKAGAGIGF